MRARMRHPWLFAVIAVAWTVVSAGTTAAQPTQPANLGTWILNPAKSTFSAGAAPRNATITIETAGVGVKTTVDMLAAKDAVRHWYYIASYDGKDSPIAGDSAFNDVTVALTRVDPNTTSGVFKKHRNVIYTETSVVSSDGKTMTISTTVTNALQMIAGTNALIHPSATVGHGSVSVAVYDRQ